MKVIFFQVDDVLNFPESDAIAPSGKMGIADSKVKELKKLVTDSNVKIVLVGKWKKKYKCRITVEEVTDFPVLQNELYDEKNDRLEN